MGQTEKDDGSPGEGMPQMKGLKELKLLVKQLIEKHMAGRVYQGIYRPAINIHEHGMKTVYKSFT